MGLDIEFIPEYKKDGPDDDWTYLLDDWWFPIIEYFKEVGVEQVHISFGY